MTWLHFLGYTSLVVSIIALAVVFYHWRFFSKGEKSELSKRMALVFLSDMLVYTSVAAYGLNWIVFDGGSDIRTELKIFQIAGICFNLFALSKLIAYYRKLK